MLQAIKFISIVVGFLPTILSIVQKVEKFYKEKDGAEKKKIAMSMLQEVFSKKFSNEKTDSIVQVVDKGIDFVVAVLNAYKLWK